ncbi:homeobox protein 5 [Malaya genurostris]|uniref:homeobox protein 5 n=1 Tax=Malaya genurostris TaxID=325434 RepID=UPI0026F3A3A0|nr:homeobox protein 5 [Malaya genurostris]XP_058465314.1 homeobox protein 5 [Malaya genurostris]XP_058465315.1 homeobox protein 5 [Malaya genurostris]XP_058465316.1 homeobox protein 5 [Malaya genurostris]XP_058465317.1 homeobox protein 5 [Malaya genurostris]XP_058465318.1 homeobox protein 5 [Malaya genurostris]
MFGSKLRSWMENHIVRPRKKGNKNKNGNSTSNFGILTVQNGHAKGISYTADGSTTIGSPARRSEVSPIQNHTKSRRGWQSPNQDQAPSLSPRSDEYHHYQLQQNIRGTTTAPVYGNGTLPSSGGGHTSVSSFGNTGYNANGYLTPHQQHQSVPHSTISSPKSILKHNYETLQSSGGNYSKSVDNNYSHTMYGLQEEGYRKSAARSSIVATKNANCNGSYGNVMVNSLNYSTATSSSNELLEDLHHIEQNRIKKGQHIKISSSSSSSINSNNNMVNNNSFIGSNNNMYIANNGFETQGKYTKIQSLPGKQQISQQYSNTGVYYEQHNSINNNLVHTVSQYPSPQDLLKPVGTAPTASKGQNIAKSNRLITSRNSNNNNNNGFEICAAKPSSASSNQSNTSSSTLSSFTQKFHKLTGTRNSLDATANGSKLNHVNNNIHNNNGSSNSNGDPSGAPSGGPAIAYHLHKTLQPPTQPPHQQPAVQTHHGHPLGNGASNGHHSHSHPHPHPVGHHNTLSSPESAYSTGYSTDGTSPGGCSYTPEYYINIRTGTHYFPKGLTACSGGAAGVGSGSGAYENGNKFKCGLNRIEEKHVEFSVEDLPSPKKICEYSKENSVVGSSTTAILKSGSSINNNNANNINNNGNLSQQQQQTMQNAVAMSPIMQKNLGMQHYRSIESPSPRQRCRIRTNPWLSTLDGSLAGANLKKTDQDSGSTTSSGIKSSSGTDDNKKDPKKPNVLSDSDSSSSTEKVVSKMLLTPRSIRKGAADLSRLDSKATTNCSNLDSDEDATLNEMMGKFDESYHYEKETDILSCSDSDPTDCPTDIDTGQDAGDECDTDDLLDLDFIDTGSVLEVIDKENYKNTGSCSYHNFPERRSSKHRGRSKRNSESGGSKRRKKLVRTRKKNTDQTSGTSPAGSMAASRGCRSLGGTPVSLRRNQSEERTPINSSPLTNRCNSLTFTEVHSLHSRILAISESEKALLKADLEADVKYKQLIHEAETILFSMRTNSVKELKEIKEPPSICSPRRICNPPANKRVEILRNCEADLKRELAKTCSQKCSENGSELNPVEGVIINKRLEVLRYETSMSAPNSPKNTRVIPRKTHVTNFINQNHCTELARRQSDNENDLKSAKMSPQPVSYERNIVPPKSPIIARRRFRSQSPKINIESDSDSDDLSRNLDKNHCKNKSNKENISSARKSITGKQLNNFRHTIHGGGSAIDANVTVPSGKTIVYSSSLNESDMKRGLHKSPLMSFRSVDIGNMLTDDSYCPQSEPLKRKIYTCSSTFEKIQRSLDADPELSKKALLNKITLLRRERLSKTKQENNCKPGHEPTDAVAAVAVSAVAQANDNGNVSVKVSCELSGGARDAEAKQQLIMSTLADIKRSLEDQSVELNELNDSDY